MLIYSVSNELQQAIDNGHLVVESLESKKDALMLRLVNTENRKRLVVKFLNPHFTNTQFETSGSHVQRLALLEYRTLYKSKFFLGGSVQLTNPQGDIAEIRGVRG